MFTGKFTQQYQTPNRLWLADDHGTEIMPGVPLDLTLFNAAQHYPNGYIPDGIVLGMNTTTGKYGPYLGTATDGRQNAVGIMFNPEDVFATAGLVVQGAPALLTMVTTAIFLHGFVNASKLPFTSTNAALGGYLDTAAQTALKNIIFLPASLTA